MVAEYNTIGEMTRRYVHNVGTDVPLLSYEGGTLSLPSYLHADHQGSIVAVSDPYGVGSVNTYDEYGIPGVANVGRFQYTGQIWLPELGMYYYKARVYSPTLGRFLQTDPVGYQGGVNLYAYVESDPVNQADPSGTIPAVPCTGSRIGCGDQNGGLCLTCSGFGGLGYQRHAGQRALDNIRGNGTERDDGERVELACLGPLTFLRPLCARVIGQALRRIAVSRANNTARAVGLTINRNARIGSGGRSGENVGNLIGPPNSVVGKPGGNGLWFTNSRGQVVRDLTFTGQRAPRAFEVVPGRGTVGLRLSLTREEWIIWNGF